MGFTEAGLAILQQRQAAANPSLAPKAKRRKSDTSEAEIQQTCTQILMHDGWRPLRTDPVSDRKRGKGFGECGMPDYLYVRYGGKWAVGSSGHIDEAIRADAQVLWIEFKKDGGKPEPHQLAWHAAERAKGAMTLIAGVDFPATIEGFDTWYSSSGLKRGGRS